MVPTRPVLLFRPLLRLVTAVVLPLNPKALDRPALVRNLVVLPLGPTQVRPPARPVRRTHCVRWSAPPP